MATAKQIAWRKKFAAMAKAGTLPKRNPVAKRTNAGDYITVRFSVAEVRAFGIVGKHAKPATYKFTRDGSMYSCTRWCDYVPKDFSNAEIRALDMMYEAACKKVKLQYALPRFANPIAKKTIPRKGVSKAEYISRPSQITRKKASPRLKARRVQAKKAPKAGYFPNPRKDNFLFIVHRADANGKPVYDVAKFRRKTDAVAYAKAYAKACSVPVCVETKKL